MNKKEVRRLETDILLTTIFQRYGYDFRNYARSTLGRQISRLMDSHKLSNVSELIPLVLHDTGLLNELLNLLTINVTELFRDPVCYEKFREHVIPMLKSYPCPRVWIAGCSTGEEAYSTAITLHEDNLLKQSHIYATDINNHSLEKAKNGVYHIEDMKLYTKNYIKFAGKAALSEYYHARYKHAKMNDYLKKRITFANHNLTTDGVFAEMNVVSCRNVMIYFDQELKERVFRLFTDALCTRGYLCLGSKENLEQSEVMSKYEIIDRKAKIYRKL